MYLADQRPFKIQNACQQMIFQLTETNLVMAKCNKHL